MPSLKYLTCNGQQGFMWTLTDNKSRENDEREPGHDMSHEIFLSIHKSIWFKIQNVEISEDYFIIHSITEDRI